MVIGGIAGLTAALHLAERKLCPLVLEADDASAYIWAKAAAREDYG